VSDLFLHTRLASSAAAFTFMMALWASYLAIRGEGIGGSYLGAVVVGEALLVVQGLLGVWLWLGRGLGPARGIHILYGAMVVLIWPFVLTFSRGTGQRGESLRHAAAAFFLWGLVVRAIDTAGL
jgi:hypothetical protein